MNNDPMDWRLLGSNDRGQTWTVLDVQTNQHFRRLQRRPFPIRNRTPYNTYRLQFDRASWAESATNGRPSLRSDVELAEVELIGPLVGGYAEEAVQPNITASQGHPLMGLPENAFDGDPHTRWRGFDIGKSGGCWIQCEYASASASESIATNLSQLTILAGRAGASDPLGQKGLSILSKLDAKGGGMPRVLTGYALTSANDHPECDPRDWRLLGSNDNGKSWNLLDERRDELFAGRFERRVFVLKKPATCAMYRLEIHTVRQQASDVQIADLQIAELEPLYAVEDDRAYTLVVSASLENPPTEGVEKAFDRDPTTRWLSFVLSTSTLPTTWVQWQCVPVEDGLPVVNRRELDHLAETQNKARWLRASELGTPRTLCGYALTSADDYPDRDPRNWQLLGSNDGGKTWDVLDVRTNQVFASRFERREFLLGRSATYDRFRLRIDEVADVQSANCVQLAEVEPLYAPTDVEKGTAMIVSAQADNGFWESVEMAFDGNRNTKWLDYADASPLHSSWLEWRYVTNFGMPIIDLNRLLEARASKPRKVSARLEGVVVSWMPQSGELGFLDSTGFQMLILSTNHMQIGFSLRAGQTNGSGAGFDFTVGGEQALRIKAVRPGTRLRLSGQVQFVGELPQILHPCLEVTGWLAEQEANGAGIRPDSLPDFVMGTIKGQAKTEAQGHYYTTLRLTDGGSGMSFAAQILNSASLQLPSWLDCPVRVRGVIQPLFDEHGQLGPGNIWVASPDDVTFGPVDDNQGGSLRRTTNGPINETEQVLRALKSSAGEDYPVKIRGIITYIDMGLDEFYLQSGGEGIRIHYQPNAGLFPHLGQEGSYVELQGMVRDRGVYCTNSLKVLGRGKLPQPRRHSWDYLMTGKDDDQWVELEGVASAVQKQRLMLRIGDKHLIVWINDLEKGLEHSLPGSLVRVVGICSPVFNDRGQRLGLRLLTPSSECIEVVNALPKAPFELPLLPIGRIVYGEQSPTNQPARMVRTSGVVTYAAPRVLFIQSGSNGLSVTARAEIDAKVGDEIEVAGVAEADGFSLKLVDALVRRTGRGTLPVPRPVGLLTSEAANEGAQHDATRVTIEAVLLTKNTTDSAHLLTLQQDDARQTFSAFVPLKDKTAASLPIGSRLRVVGVLKAKCDTTPDFGQTVAAFDMYINSTDDITVLEHPSWWTARHTLWALSGAGGVLALALAWVILLRWEVRQRTQELHKEVEEHKRTEKQLEAEIAERKAALRFQQLLINSIPIPVFYKSEKGVYLDCNKSYEQFMGMELSMIVGRTVHEITPPELARIYQEQDVQLMAHPGVQIYECEVLSKTQPAKRHVVFHKATFEGPDGHVGGIIGGILDITALKEAELQKERVIAELQRALENVKLLSGLLPICASCKKIRDDKGYWNQLEAYICKHSEAEFSHGICPDCAKKFFAGYCDNLDMTGNPKPDATESSQ